MVFVNRDQLMDNAIKPSVQHVVAVANFIGANTENLLFSFYKRIPSKLQYFGWNSDKWNGINKISQTQQTIPVQFNISVQYSYSYNFHNIYICFRYIV